MDGSISVSSTIGEGSCFLVILPLIEQDKNFIIPIIAVGEYNIQDDIKNYEQLGFNARVDKPIELHMLYKILAEQLS